MREYFGVHLQVAVKVIDKKKAREDAYVCRNMRRESRLLQQIKHRHIIQLFEVRLLRYIFQLVNIDAIASRSQRVGLIVIPFCLSVCLDVCRSFRDLQSTTIDRSQPNLGPSDPCKPFWIPYLPYFRCQRENMQNFAYCVFLPLRT